MSTEEITLVEESEVELYSKSGSLRPLIEKIRKEVLLIAPDVTTAKGRDEIASLAYKVARSKTKVDEIEKKRGEKARLELERINSERKIWRDEMDKLKDEVRKPLTDYEERERERIRKHQDACVEIELFKTIRPGNSACAAELVEKLNAITVDAAYEEYRNKAEQAKAEALAYLSSEYTRLKKAEDDAAELERLRKAEEDRKRKEREDQIAKDAADKARKDAEEAAAKAEKARQAAQAKKEADEQAKRDAESARIAKEHADKILAIEAAKQKADAEAAKIAAEQAAKVREAEERAAAAERKAEQERKATADAAAKEAAEKAKREANQAHRKRINNEILEDLKPHCDEETAKAIITAISKGSVRHVSIGY